MERLLLILISFAAPSICMHDAIQLAIKDGNLQEVEKLVELFGHINSKSAHETHPLLKKPVDFSALHQLAQDLTPERKAQTQTRDHKAVYQRLLTGGGTVLVGVGILGITIYQDYQSGKWALDELIGTAAASFTAIAHGVKEIKLGVCNQDAHDKHAQHLAITHKLLMACNQPDSEHP